MRTKLFLLTALIVTLVSYSQTPSFTFQNARNTNDGVDDYYEADIYISSDTDFLIGAAQIFFNFNTAAFGELVFTNGNFSMETPEESIAGTTFFGGLVTAYQNKVVNDNITSRVSTFFGTPQPEATFNGGGVTVNVTSTPALLYSIKFKYIDVNEDPGVAFATAEDNPAFVGNAETIAGLLLVNDTFDSSGASLDAASSAIVWSGATSTNWFDATNWVGGVRPTATDDVEIVSGTFFPVVSSFSTVTLNNLTIDAAATLTVEGSSSSDQGGSLIVTGTATGDITYELTDFIANEFTLISAPVSGQVRSEFMSNATNDILIKTTETPNKYALGTYNDANASGAKWSYFTEDDLADTTSEFGMGAGYSFARATAGSIEFTGALTNSNVEKTVTGGEFNLLGNPYTAYLPINDAAGSFLSDNLSVLDATFPAVYTWDTAEQKYTAITLTDGEAVLAPGKGFFVHTATGTSSISLDASQLLSNSDLGEAKTVGTSFPEIQLTATANGVGVNTYVRYFESSTDGLDLGYDVGNFDGAAFDVFTKLVDGSSDVNFTQQALNTNTIEGQKIPVGLVAKAGTEVAFSVNTVNLPSGVSVYLEDVVNNTYTDISAEGVTVTIAEDTDGSKEQFYIYTAAKSLSVDDLATLSNVSIYTSASKEVSVSGITSDSTISVYTITGKLLYNGDLNANGTNKVNLSKASAGVYLVKVASEGTEVNKKIVLK